MTELLSLIHSLLLRRKAMNNLDSILKSRDITLSTKVHPVTAMVFPGVIYGFELDHKELRFEKNHLFQFLKLGFPDSSVGKESACNAGDPGLIPGSGTSPGEGIGYPFQYSWAPMWLSW